MELFLEDEKTQDAVIRNFEIIGEAARNITRHHTDYADRHPEIAWSDIYLMRNRLSHGYFTLDMELVWKTIQTDLPELAGEINQLFLKE